MGRRRLESEASSAADLESVRRTSVTATVADRMREAIRAGVAVYNAGHYHAAHDAWEDRWLDLETGTDDESLLHGLIQFTAAVHHARNRNWAGATGLAESAGAYLADLPADYRSCNVGAARRFLASLAADPELIERRSPLALSHEGQVLEPADLGPHATAVAAGVLAAALDLDEEPVERAGAFAEEDLAAGRDDSPFLALLFDFVRSDRDDRGVIYRRLREHVSRRSAVEDDVAGLFD